MELQNQNGAAVKNGTAQEKTKASSTGEAKTSTGTIAPKDNAAKTEAVKGDPATVQTKLEPGDANIAKVETKPEAVHPKAEEVPTAKPALSLEAKLKAVDNLHRISVQRLNLISRLKQLEGFEVALMQENDELEDNPYQGCKLIIEDDKRRQFVTSTPGLIRLVSQFIFNACEAKLAEIEASINFPGF